MDDMPRFADERAEGEAAAATLRTTPTVRERCAQLLARARAGGSAWFEIREEAAVTTVNEVVTAARARYPRRPIPIRSLWRHLEAGGADPRGDVHRLMAGQPGTAWTQARIDLAVVSWLLALPGAPDWTYTEPSSGRVLAGEAALAVATLHAFHAGLFSSDPERPLQADALGLRAVVTDRLAQALQVHDAPRRSELSRRVIRLRRLGELMAQQPEVFGAQGRPSGVFDLIITPYGHGVPHTADVDAHDILSQLLTCLSGLWPSGSQIGGVPLGDCWPHPAVQADGPTNGWVPFHTTLQDLTSSLLEPFLWGGAQVHGINSLTAPADRCHATLLLDTGLLRLREPHSTGVEWSTRDEIVVEWRALTLALMDEIAPRVCASLKQSVTQLPMGCILQAGTVAAGQALTQRLRGGQPVLKVAADTDFF